MTRSFIIIAFVVMTLAVVGSGGGVGVDAGEGHQAARRAETRLLALPSG